MKGTPSLTYLFEHSKTKQKSCFSRLFYDWLPCDLCVCVRPDLLVIFPIRFHTSFILSCVCSVRRINCCGFFCFVLFLTQFCLLAFFLTILCSLLSLVWIWFFRSMDPRRTGQRSWGEGGEYSPVLHFNLDFQRVKLLSYLKGTRHHEFLKSSPSSFSDCGLPLSEDDTPDSVCQAFAAFHKNVEFTADWSAQLQL